MEEPDNRSSAEHASGGISVQKYFVLKERILAYYSRGCRYLNTAKIAAAVLFVLFTAIGVYVSGRTGSRMLWLVLWIAVIFLYVAVFTAAEYCKYWMQKKLVSYLEDDARTAFDDTDILAEDEEDIGEDA